ncbi:pyridoxamine 5'-phosphate oxidase family protein [Pedobacter arcticus]|uniref:pyridoxamine 5'-phosphate oxidase family protein n=1 Tax=Pedobacter arcticus TaxID=752140 RepID=UPI0002F5F0D1|nr:pyridoxamine 5'-phosphate oxidase family protein [Pedobacter arcticus]
MENLENKENLSLLNENYIGHIAFIADNKPFTIPITYYYNQKDSILAYASEGHKIEAMRKNPNVSLQVNEIIDVDQWRSVLVHGTFEEMHGPEAKFILHEFAEGVKRVISKKENRKPQFISEFTSDVYSTGVTVVYRIKISQMTGKKMAEEKNLVL